VNRLIELLSQIVILWLLL